MKARRRAVVVALVTAGIPLIGGEPASAGFREVPVIEVLSNRADLVSGGDALVDVSLPGGIDATDIRMELDGRDITHEFALRSNGRYQGVVTGLREGENELVARTSQNSGSKLTITNHSKQGPVFAGEQVEPWICETEQAGLGPATGPDCVAPTRFDFFYKSTVTGEFEDYDPGSPPSDPLVAETTTDEGETVPFIVRRERGVIDRGIYDIAVLHQPGEDWEPWAPQDAWNGKVHWLFRGACNPSHRQHGPTDVLETQFLGDLPLARGFMVATSSLNWLAQNCNDVVSAEAVMMVKEHLVETYGPVRYTTAEGSSGGSMQQHLIANNYPGLLDGMMPIASFPDLWSLAQELGDCSLLSRYFNETSPQLWADPTDRAAVNGSLAGASCQVNHAFDELAAWFEPRLGCTADTTGDRVTGPEEWTYDPQTNPDGVRCTLQDYQLPVFGERASDGFANRPLDNVGVQFGLTALLHEQISPEQFVDLNVRLGGRDIDYNWTPQRTVADLEGLRNLYWSGRINDGGQLDRVPIMDVRPSSNVEVHEDFYTQVTRKRLIAANGHADNQVAWVTPSVEGVWTSPVGADSETTVRREAFRTLDEWLAAIEVDTGDASLETKVVRNKPAQAKDTCWLAGKPGACGSNLPSYADPRLVAGAPLTHDIQKCQLKSIDWDEYGSVEFTEEQKRQLDGAFPDGVCDWTKPGVEQQPPAGVWQTFATTTGGEPLGPTPKSVSFHGHP